MQLLGNGSSEAINISLIYVVGCPSKDAAMSLEESLVLKMSAMSVG